MANDGSPPLTRGWVMDPDSKKVFCFRSHVPGCFPSTLRAHNDPTDPFHNETLVTATNEINAATCAPSPSSSVYTTRLMT